SGWNRLPDTCVYPQKSCINKRSAGRARHCSSWLGNIQAYGSAIQRRRIPGRTAGTCDQCRSTSVGDFLQHRDRPDPATLIGKGKLDEIAGAAASVSADLLLFDHDLTASQQRNIE